MTRVLHLPFSYFPDPAGGTEVYVAALARELDPLGIESVVAAPSSSAAGTTVGNHEGVRVHRYAVGENADGRIPLGAMYGEGDPRAERELEKVFDAEAPDVVHFHALTAGASLRVLRAARRRGISSVFTYHTPTTSCLRGTLLHNGVAVCDGVLDVRRCAACTLRARGVPHPVGEALARLPRAVGRAAGRAGLEGRVWTALRTSELTGLRHDTFRAVAAEADAVVAVCDWVRELLERNGVAAERIVSSRQGVQSLPPRPFRGDRDPGAPVRVAFFGRIAREKGIDVLVRAARAASAERLRVDVFGVVQSGAEADAYGLLGLRSDGDVRLRLLPPVASADVAVTMANYDAVAVPSQGLETGPLVVLEAFAAGVPVIGSRLGGIAELVSDGVDGLLVEPTSVSAWTAALERFATDAPLRDRLAAGVRPPRTMSAVAREMASLYSSLAARSDAPSGTRARTAEASPCP